MMMNIPTSTDQLPHFNLETMSGIFPGTRTRQFHVLKLLPLEGDGRDDITSMKADSVSAGRWAKVFWLEDVREIVVITELGEVLCQVESSDYSAATFRQLQHAIGEHSYQIASCGSCLHWLPENAEPGCSTPLGKCSWQMKPNGTDELHTQQDWTGLRQELGPQSAFALRCDHWSPQIECMAASESATNDEAAMTNLAEPAFGSEPIRDVNLGVPGEQPPAAEQSAVKQTDSWMRKLSRVVGFGAKKGKTAQKAQLSTNSVSAPVEDSVVSPSLQALDRSGVGAGTEPCLGCHGRIANLGALVVETQEGDPQTYSIWRCRVCASTYLNSWVDRWERLENLETEEHLYRLPPMEAFRLLKQINGVADGDHPQERGNRTQIRDWFDSFRSSRSALSHQIRRGR